MYRCSVGYSLHGYRWALTAMPGIVFATTGLLCGVTYSVVAKTIPSSRSSWPCKRYPTEHQYHQQSREWRRWSAGRRHGKNVTARPGKPDAKAASEGTPWRLFGVWSIRRLLISTHRLRLSDLRRYLVAVWWNEWQGWPLWSAPHPRQLSSPLEATTHNVVAESASRRIPPPATVYTQSQNWSIQLINPFAQTWF